jgi:hypothetical protein
MNELSSSNCKLCYYLGINYSSIFFATMADKASSSAVKDPTPKTVLELLEEDDEFEVSSS